MTSYFSCGDSYDLEERKKDIQNIKKTLIDISEILNGYDAKCDHNIENIKNGRYTEFHSNSRVKILSHYKNGVLDGEYTEFDNKGSIIKRLMYINGIKKK